MPRIDRKIRKRDTGLTQAAVEVLTFGHAICAGTLINLADSGAVAEAEKQSSATMAELKRLWLQHSPALMGQHFGPGRRPWGFYVFDLRVPAPCNWWGEIQALLDAGAIDATEAARIEAENPILHPSAAEAGFGSAVTSEQYGAGAVARMRAKCETAARWHEWRGRPSAAEYFRRLASTEREAPGGNKTYCYGNVSGSKLKLITEVGK